MRGMKSQRAGAVLAVLVVALAFPSSALALTMRSEASVVVPRGQTVADDLYAFGNSVTIDGGVNGDVVAFAQIVTINGDVSGSVISAAQNVRVGGTVDGAIRAAGALVEITGTAGGDVLAGAAEVVIDGDVARDVAAGAQNVVISGAVGRNLLVGSESLLIGGPVGGDVRAESTNVTVLGAGSVAGDLDYWSNTEADVQGTVSGTTTRHQPVANQGAEEEREPGGGFASAVLGVIWAWLQSLVGFVLLGIVMVYALRSASERSSEVAIVRLWPSVGVGALVFFGAPAVAGLVFLFGLFIGAWWLSFVLMSVYWLLLLAGMVVGALALGRAILRRARSAGEAALVWSMLLGIGLVWLVLVVPFIGWLAAWLVMLAGTGALVLL